MKKIVFLIIIIFLFNGCNTKELNKLAIASAVGIDKNNDGFEVVVQIVNTDKSNISDNNKKDFTIYSAYGNSLEEAFSNIILKSSRKLYISHIKLLLIGEEIAKEGILPILDYFFHNNESRNQFMVLISKGSKPEEILEIITPHENLNAKKIKEAIVATGKYLGISEAITFENVLEAYINPNKDISIPAVEKIKNNDSVENEFPSVTPQAVFKNDKLLGFLTRNESMALLYIKNKVKESVVSYSNGNSNLSVQTKKIKTKIDVHKQDLLINIKIDGEAEVKENSLIINNNKIKEIEKIINNQIKDMLIRSISSINSKYNSDIFGFLDLFYKKNPVYYNEIKDSLQDDLNKIKINIDINIKVKSNGDSLGRINYEN